MTFYLFAVLLLLVGAVAVSWLVHRSSRIRREAEEREARVLEAMFDARRSGEGPTAIDVDAVFGRKAQDAAGASADAVLRAAGVKAEVVELLAGPPATVPAPASAAPPPIPPPAPPPAPVQTGRPSPASKGDGAPVRDLVQVFYEARGFRARVASSGGGPIETVLEHHTDSSRSYAFVPLSGDLTDEGLRPIVTAARRIGQARVLIACEGRVSVTSPETLPAQGVQAFDRAGIDSQLARASADIAEQIRATARRRAARRQSAS